MKMNIELYASLMPLLPPGNERFRREISLDDEFTVQQLIDHLKIPPDQAHIVLINGNFVNVEDRSSHQLQANDTMAVWPPVAGG